LDLLIKHLRKHIPQADLTPFLQAFKEKRTLKKGEYLVRPQQNTLFLAFINKGGFRVFFYNKKGQDITTWLAFKDMWVTDLLSYYNNEPATYYVQALEDSEVYIIQKSKLEELYKHNKDYLSFAKNFAEAGMIVMLERSNHIFQEYSAEERYLKLLGTPVFKNNVPLKHIATFLGITETSLSRIRRKISKE